MIQDSMDSVYGPYNKNASAKINIKEFFDEYLALTKPYRCYSNTEEDGNKILEIMKTELGADEMALLSEYCSVDNLTIPHEPEKIDGKHLTRKNLSTNVKVADDVNLKTVENLKEQLSQGGSSIHQKHQSELLITYEKETENKAKAVPGRDILVFVRVYEPFKSSVYNPNEKSKGPLACLNSVISILGSQTLSQLRDKIRCLSDLSIATEASNNLDDSIGPLAKDVYTSGFFYIEDTFYNDYRNPMNQDNSKVIIEWATCRKLGPFKISSMENTRIDSLKVRFGFPWVYQHQGNCEHLIVLSDARLVNADDELIISAYPRIQKIRPRSSKYCMMCGLLSVRWIITESDRIPHNPCYFCDTCFLSYNYIDGKKIGNFKAYAYPCRSDLVARRPT